MKKIFISIFISFIVFSLSFTKNVTKNKPGVMRNITTMELTREMGIGLNLGNTFDAHGDWVKKWGDGTPESYYTCWGAPKMNQEMILGVYDEGFRVLRVPVHWFNLMEDDYTISPEYMKVVKQTVDWALEAGLYVIVNIHHDNGLFKNFTVDYDESMYGYKRIWKQIAETFKDYSDYLMLEALNEEACWDSVYNRWGGDEGKEEVFDLVNSINQAFVDVVRKTGGNNKERHLLVSGYCTDIEQTTDRLFKMPKDPMNRLAVSVHYYTPSTFSIISEDADWGKAQKTWGTKDDIKQLNKLMDLMAESYIDNNIPVIIGEYGCTTEKKEYKSVQNYLYSVCKAAYDRKMVPILWDGPQGFYNRTLGMLNDGTLKEMLISVVEDDD